jgi:multisubunit Na+/H+ antiporter MnhG subunit
MMETEQARTQVRTANIITFLAGLWLIFAPSILTYITPAAASNDVTVGIIVAIIAAIRYFIPTRAAWLSWINIFLGIWLIIAPFGLGYIEAAAIWNDIIVGIIVAGLAIWSSYGTAKVPYTRSAPHRT